MLSTFMYLVLIYMLAFSTTLRTTFAQGKLPLVVKCRRLAVYKCGSKVELVDETSSLNSIKQNVPFVGSNF